MEILMGYVCGAVGCCGYLLISNDSPQLNKVRFVNEKSGNSRLFEMFISISMTTWYLSFVQMIKH